jgi:hypothetical protein
VGTCSCKWKQDTNKMEACQWYMIFHKRISVFHLHCQKNKKQTNSVALSPRANYTDWATATCRRNFSANFCG